MASARASQWNLPGLLRDIPTRMAFGCPLAPYTSLRVGGPVDALVQIDNLATLRQVLAIANRHEIPLSVLGGGSNILIRDAGIRGIMLLMRGAFRSYGLQPNADGETAVVKVGHRLLVVTLGNASRQTGLERPGICLRNTGNAWRGHGDERRHQPRGHEWHIGSRASVVSRRQRIQLAGQCSGVALSGLLVSVGGHSAGSDPTASTR